MKQLTKEESLEFYESGVWKSWDAKQIVDFQLFQKKLCVDFNVFQRAMEEVLRREVYTHEFADMFMLQKEYLGEKSPPTMEEILNYIPLKHRKNNE